MQTLLTSRASGGSPYTYHLLTGKEKHQRWKHVKAIPAELKMFASLIGKAEWKSGAGESHQL